MLRPDEFSSPSLPSHFSPRRSCLLCPCAQSHSAAPGSCLPTSFLMPRFVAQESYWLFLCAQSRFVARGFCLSTSFLLPCFVARGFCLPIRFVARGFCLPTSFLLPRFVARGSYWLFPSAQSHSRFSGVLFAHIFFTAALRCPGFCLLPAFAQFRFVAPG